MSGRPERPPTSPNRRGSVSVVRTNNTGLPQGANTDPRFAPQVASPNATSQYLPASPSPGNFGLSSEQQSSRRRLPSSGMSELGQKFIDEAPFQDVKATIDFIKKHPAVFKEKTATFFSEAVNAYAVKDESRARNCIEKSILLKHCCQPSNEDRAKVLKLWEELDRNILQRFSEDMEALWKACVEKGQELTTKQEAEKKPKKLAPYPSIHGTGGEKESIDPRFRKRNPKEAGKFFKLGHVFAMIWHMEDTGPREHYSIWNTTTDRGEKLLAHVTRMAVVKEAHGYCWAIPINSYGGNGLVKKGLSEEDKQAHAIIHMDDQRPEALPDEPILRKRPIAVTMCTDQTLHEASRINFAKIHTVEHNVKAMDIGHVATKSLPYFKQYFKDHLN